MARNKPSAEKRPLPVAFLTSLGLHLALVVLAIFGLPRFRDPAPMLSSMQVSLISAAELAAAQVQPAAPESEPEPQPEPQPEPEPTLPDPTPPDTALALPEAAAPDPGPAPQLESTPPPPVDRVAPQAVPEQDLPDATTFVPPQAEVPQPQPQPQLPQEPGAPQEASPQTITEAVETEAIPAPVPQTAPRPAPRPQRAPEVVAQDTPPAPEPQPVPDPAPEPQPEPARDPIAAAIAAALEKSQSTPSPAPTTTPSGPPLTGGERDALRVAVGRCWNPGSSSTEAMRVTVTVAMDMTSDGLPVSSSIRMIDYTDGSQSAAQTAFDAARRAILRCQGTGYPLPTEKYGQWSQIEMTFNPERMRLR